MTIAFIILSIIGKMLIGALIGATVMVLTFMILAPFLIVWKGWLVNKPGKTGPSGPHMFTYIGPGDVKWVIRGKTPVRAIENTGGLTFERKGTDRQVAAYWKIKNTPNQREKLFAEIFWLLRPWAWYVFKISGCVFTGIWPFQRVYEYQLNRVRIIPDETKIEAGVENATRIEPVSDWSDHFRNRMFQITVLITGAETKDKIPLNFIDVFEGQVTNPFLAAWNNDGWENALVAFIRARRIEKIRTMLLDEVLSAIDIKATQAMNETALPRNMNGTVKKGHPLEKSIGIMPLDLKTVQIDAVGTPEQLQMLRAAGFAVQQAQATVTDGKARAEVITLMKTAEGDDGGLALTLEAQTKQVGLAAAHGNLILLGGGASTANPMDVAQLDAFRRRNKAEVTPQPGAAPAVSATEPEGH